MTTATPAARPEHPVVTKARQKQAEANHDFLEQEMELKTNTQLTREIHVLTTELHRRVIDGR